MLPGGQSSEHADTALLRVSKRRALAIVFVFGFWSLLVGARLVQIMVLDRGTYLVDIDASWRHGMIPAMRGRILDVDGRPLAWSTRQFVLRWDVPHSLEVIARSHAIVDSGFALTEAGWSIDRLIACRGRAIVLKTDLSPAEYVRATGLRDDVPGLTVQSRFVRHRHAHPAIRRRLGTVQIIDGMEVGSSGEELRHDNLLRGRPGMYRVMIDTDGAWLFETFEYVRVVEPGYDVYLPVRVPPPLSGED